ncbi:MULTISPECIES: DUF6278 family protein [unclassified Streptomyces]|uniref:DUF6278 family protein n=1 Tax=unclassified Streptomyces TaxID=2593676 RepID=UPI00278BBBEB|nr:MULTISPECIES: DUF6278 family protein [unclassified Streptomyces]
MKIPFAANWRKKPGPAHGVAVFPTDGDGDGDEAETGLVELLSECELLRSRADDAGVELDESVGSLAALDQIEPDWRGDEDELHWLGNDAGLYLGSVMVRHVPGASWVIWDNGQPVVRLTSGREIDVVETGHDWAATGAPELSQFYAEAAES